MISESIFSFLGEDKIFQDVFKTYLELENTFVNEMIYSAFYQPRVEIEEFLKL